MVGKGILGEVWKGVEVRGRAELKSETRVSSVCLSVCP
jgi:hypothetical protein